MSAKKDDPTYQQVKDAIEKLIATGVPPSVDQIWRMVEKKIPKYIVSKHFLHWQEQHKENRIQASKGASKLKNLVNQKTQELEQSLAIVRATLESTTDGILVTSNRGKILDYNEKFVEMMGVDRTILESRDEQVVMEWGKRLFENPEDFFQNTNSINEKTQGQGRVADLHLKTGKILERYSQPLKVGERIIGRVWSNRDVTQRRKSDEELRLQKRAIEASTQGIVILDITQGKSKVVFANPAVEKITGYRKEEALGKELNWLLSSDLRQPGFKKLQIAIKEQREEQVELQCYRKDGGFFWADLHLAPVIVKVEEMPIWEEELFRKNFSQNSDFKVEHFVFVINDITEQKAMEEQLRYQATHDHLTALPNRTLLLDRLRQAIYQARRTQEKVAVLFLDLDRFKLVNDSLSHGVGDMLLNSVAKRLKELLKEGDTIARIGGDEFVIVTLPPFKNKEINTLAQTILKKIAEPIKIEGKELNMTASIGICYYPTDGTEVNVLLRNADTAMYQAKDQGRNNFQFFTKEMNKKVRESLSLENSLRVALQQNEFVMRYQPIISIANNKISGFEALLRWQHEGELVSPAKFITLVEEIGLIVPIGEWVLMQACQFLKQLDDIGLGACKISVNISSQQLHYSDIVSTVKKTIDTTGINAQRLQLELTESVLLKGTTGAIDILHQLKALGTKLVLDDFGTGYSSLSYLKLFPIDKLKIDQSFVRDIHGHQHDPTIILAIIALAKSMHLSVTAEGIENKQQLLFLREHHCDEGQGYLFSKPVDDKTCIELLKKDQQP